MIKLEGIGCTKRNDFCQICEFWEKNEKVINGLENKKMLPVKVKNLLIAINEDDKKVKGNVCKSMGDCIIALETLKTKKQSSIYF